MVRRGRRFESVRRLSHKCPQAPAPVGGPSGTLPDDCDLPDPSNEAASAPLSGAKWAALGSKHPANGHFVSSWDRTALHVSHVLLVLADGRRAHPSAARCQSAHHSEVEGSIPARPIEHPGSAATRMVACTRTCEACALGEVELGRCWVRKSALFRRLSVGRGLFHQCASIVSPSRWRPRMTRRLHQPAAT
jgi:hypothetical protein